MTDTGLYFAYGANMDPAVLKRRRIHAITSEAAWVDDYFFDFGVPGLPVLEPGFATIRPRQHARTHGVVHRISNAELTRLDGFESDQERFEVRVEGDAVGLQTATTYRSFKHCLNGRPSRRYLQILIRGAELHDLPPEWIASLKSTPNSHVPILSDLWTLAFPAFDRLNRLSDGLLARLAEGPSRQNDA